MCITNDILTRHITLDQTQYVLKVLKKFGMADCKPVATHLPKKTVLCRATNQEAQEACSYPYLQVIGSVMYAMLVIRPNIAYTLSTLPSFTSCPGMPHIQALKHLL